MSMLSAINTAAAAVLLAAVSVLPSGVHAQQVKDDGYRGIWYANQPSGDEYKFKYSGGFATYP